ncbi:MAG TPA: ABC transporter substrate-binding protein [Candidatus Dormibacteraeota bacterium]|nr:ABC transporter substrate-binding protein [Candidatus Dormibacteraeota bacterium]
MAAAVGTTGCGDGQAPIRIGALFPLSSAATTLAKEQLAGVDIARQLVNEDGGVGGRPIELDVRDLPSADRAGSVVGQLRDAGVTAVIGAYSSDLSIAASAATANAGLVYWEAGAVADRVTGRGLPTVFRVGATGGNLGTNTARFTVEQLAPRLHRDPSQLRVSIVEADDEYAHSVAGAATVTATAAGMHIVSTSLYNPGAPRWQPVLDAVRAAAPNILILVSHIPDGVSFVHAMRATGLHVDAFIGSTMAECVPEFGTLAGSDAVGVFASDRPGTGFDPGTLRPEGRALYSRLAQKWQERLGGTPTEEGLSGFSAAWTLFHEVLPRAQAHGTLDPAGISAAARQVDLPEGSLPNGAGVRFASSTDRMGQNLRAAAVIWQWQGVGHSVVVWPSEYATGTIRLASAGG